MQIPSPPLRFQRKMATQIQIRACAIQMNSDDTGNKSKNAELVKKLVGELCDRIISESEGTNDASIPTVVLLPELALTGYSFNRTLLWSLAEPTLDSTHDTSLCVTELLLTQLASQHGIHVGCSFLEACKEDGHFYNTFALASPSGEIAGRVRKSLPAGAESFLFRGGQDTDSKTRVIVSDGLRLGVLICYENYLASCIQQLQLEEEQLDLVLQPFSAPLYEPRWDLYEDRCSEIARLLQAPAIYVNKWGSWTSPGLYWTGWEYKSDFPGGCAVCGAEGDMVFKMGQTGDAAEFAIVESGKTAGPRLRAKGVKREIVDIKNGKFVGGDWVLHIATALEWVGSWSYERSEERKEMALAVFGGQ